MGSNKMTGEENTVKESKLNQQVDIYSFKMEKASIFLNWID